MLRSIEWDKMAGNVPSATQDLNDPYVNLSMDLVNEEVNNVGELLDSYQRKDLEGVVDGLGDVLKVVCQACYSLGINPDELLQEINDSNYSKFCKDEECAIKSVMAYFDDPRYYNVFYRKVGDVYVIFGYKAGQVGDKATEPKVLKGIHYREPDVKKFIKHEGSV